MDQPPVPTVGLFAASIVLILHMYWSGPALAVVGRESTFITTSSVDGVQAPFDMVQRKVFVVPVVSPVIELVGEAEFVMIPDPETSVHFPVPVAGAFAASVAVVNPHTVWSGPAFAAVGTPLIVICIVSETSHGACPVVERVSVTIPAMISAALGVYVAFIVVLFGVKAPVPSLVQLLPGAFVIFPLNTTAGLVAQTTRLDPAFAVAKRETVIIASSVDGGQTPLETVQRNV